MRNIFFNEKLFSRETLKLSYIYEKTVGMSVFYIFKLVNFSNQTDWANRLVYGFA